MADELKQTFIEAVRLTPDGISDFLTTPIPTAPTISTPADVDAAIIANGIAAKFVCDLFQPFAGLTPIELLLRIGQHNNVLESAMLAGLEYITETEEVNDLEILAPSDGDTLKPGDVLLSAQAKNGTLIQCAVEIEGHAPISLSDTDGIFEGTITLEEPGEYTANFTGLFEKDKTAAASVTFTIDEEGDEPGGNNKQALKKALKKLTDALAWLMKNLLQAGGAIANAAVAGARSAFESVCGIAGKLCPADKQAALETLKTEGLANFDALSDAIEAQANEDAANAMALINTTAAKIAALL